MKVIKYQTDETHMFIPCQYRCDTNVGSAFCQQNCKHNIACDPVKKIIICNFDESQVAAQPNDAPETPPRAEQLAEDHWAYVSELLSVSGLCGAEIKSIGFHYKSAMIHGWKHRDEDPKGHECVFTHNGRCVVCGRVSK
jgi:hypothetical protein